MGRHKNIRVVVVDDSATMRALITRKLEREDDIEVVASASHAQEARQVIKQTDPDVITLDIEMPGMNGLDFLEKIMTLRPTPVTIVSGSTRAGARATSEALRLGAINCYAKSQGGRSLVGDDGGALAKLVRDAASAKLKRTAATPSPPPPGTPAAKARACGTRASSRPDLIVIGSSTGGVDALHVLLSDFPEDCPPTMIVQHVAECFAPAIIDALDATARPRVIPAQSDLPLRPGTVMVAPGDDRHLAVARAGSHGFRAILRKGPPVGGHCPSVDRLFASAAETVGSAALGILLTGMGRDGADGLLAMANAGAHTIAQDEASCVVFGMPRAAIELGAACDVLPLAQISRSVLAKTSVPT